MAVGTEDPWVFSMGQWWVKLPLPLVYLYPWRRVGRLVDHILQQWKSRKKSHLELQITNTWSKKSAQPIYLPTPTHTCGNPYKTHTLEYGYRFLWVQVVVFVMGNPQVLRGQPIPDPLKTWFPPNLRCISNVIGWAMCTCQPTVTGRGTVRVRKTQPVPVSMMIHPKNPVGFQDPWCSLTGRGRPLGTCGLPVPIPKYGLGSHDLWIIHAQHCIMLYTDCCNP